MIKNLVDVNVEVLVNRIDYRTMEGIVPTN